MYPYIKTGFIHIYVPIALFLALLYDVIMALVAHFLSILIMMMFHKELDRKEILPSGNTSQ